MFLLIIYVDVLGSATTGLSGVIGLLTTGVVLILRGSLSLSFKLSSIIKFNGSLGDKM